MVVWALAMARPDVLPSAKCTASAPRIGIFRGSMAGLCAPLSTLRRNPRLQLRMTRGRCGLLLLHRKRLALSTPCRSPGASQMFSALASKIVPPRLPIMEGPRCRFASDIDTAMVDSLNPRTGWDVRKVPILLQKRTTPKSAGWRRTAFAESPE